MTPGSSSRRSQFDRVMEIGLKGHHDHAHGAARDKVAEQCARAVRLSPESFYANRLLNELREKPEHPDPV